MQLHSRQQTIVFATKLFFCQKVNRLIFTAFFKVDATDRVNVANSLLKSSGICTTPLAIFL